MANTVVLKRSAVPNKIPTTSDLALGELALNTNDGNLFFKRDASGTQSILSVATLTGTQTLTNKTINLGNNTLVATSAQLASALTDETGSGSVVFGTNPTLSLAYNSVTINGLSNTTTVAPSYSNSIFHSPMSAVIWHDLVAFGTIWGFPTYETYNGTDWSSATLNKNLFSQKENQSIQILNGTTILAARWTWSNTAFSAARWLQIGQAWSTPSPNKTILVESSSNGGTTWRTLHTSTYSNVAESIFHKLDDIFGDSTLRLTVTWNSGGTVQFANIRVLTSRPGDQGRGKEFEYPYTWDADKNITIGGTQLIIKGSTTGSVALQAQASASGTLSFPNGNDVLVGRASTDTLTNKTLTSPTINSGTANNLTLTGTLTAGGGVGTNGQVLASTGTGVQWISNTTSTLNSLTDVVISAPTNDQVLKFNGAVWVNGDVDVATASAVFAANAESDLGLVTDLIIGLQEDLGFVTDVPATFIYNMGSLVIDGIVSLNNLDQSVKADYISYAIIFGF
jgi:hypothetical protein